MGFWDRFKKPTRPPAASNATPATESEPPSGFTNPAVVAKDGCEISVYDPQLEPSVRRTAGGVIIANLGVASDDPDRELELILGGVEAALQVDAPPANVVNVNRGITLEELFAPADLPTLPFRSPIDWVFHRGSIESVLASAARLEALIRCIHGIATTFWPIQQAIYIVDPPAPAYAPFVKLMRTLGVTIRRPDPQLNGLVVLLEVKRRDGQTVCLMAGPSYDGDIEARRPDPLDDVLALAKQVSHREPVVAFRAPGLSKVMFELEAGDDRQNMTKLIEVLLKREFPLFIMRNKQTAGLEVRHYGDAGTALPVYVDQMSLHWTAEDLDKPHDTYDVGVFDARTLVEMVAGGKLGLALCTFRHRKMPVYAILPATLVATISGALR